MLKNCSEYPTEAHGSVSHSLCAFVLLIWQHGGVGGVLRKFCISLLLLRLVVKVRDDKYSRTAGRALLVDGGYFPGQLGLIETSLGVRSSQSIILLFSAV